MKEALMSGHHDLTRKPGARFRLKDFDTDPTGSKDGKAEAVERLETNGARLHGLQERLYAEQRQSLLIVLQAMDTAGKDGTIEHVCGCFNPQGVQVTSFKAPSPEELSHDFLWRVHPAAPRRGMIGLFNRSHYEDVLVVRVKSLAPKKVWSARYGHINAFEALLADSGVRIVKLFLHITADEQAERLRDRQTTPEKHWKFNPGDLEDRSLWHEYQKAYEDALTNCNTAHAPWFVVPADRKWYRNLIVSEILLDVLEDMNPKFPDSVPDIESYSIPDV
jgi:PPK2 family polyphosphate:nucleotide phosphotransferase